MLVETEHIVLKRCCFLLSIDVIQNVRRKRSLAEAAKKYS